MMAFILDCFGNYLWLKISATFINQRNGFEAKLTEMVNAEKSFFFAYFGSDIELERA